MSFDLSLKLMRMVPMLSQQCSLCLFVEVKFPQYQGIRVDYFNFSKIHALMLSQANVFFLKSYSFDRQLRGLKCKTKQESLRINLVPNRCVPRSQNLLQFQSCFESKHIGRNSELSCFTYYVKNSQSRTCSCFGRELFQRRKAYMEYDTTQQRFHVCSVYW